MQTQYRKVNLIDLANLKNSYIVTEDDIENNYDPFAIYNLQYYNPIYSYFFEMNESNYQRVTLKHKYMIHDLNTVLDVEENLLISKPVFIKFSPLLDPVKYMIGKYSTEDNSIRTLPSIMDNACHCKLSEKK